MYLFFEWCWPSLLNVIINLRLQISFCLLFSLAIFTCLFDMLISVLYMIICLHTLFFYWGFEEDIILLFGYCEKIVISVCNFLITCRSSVSKVLKLLFFGLFSPPGWMWLGLFFDRCFLDVFKPFKLTMYWNHTCS